MTDIPNYTLYGEYERQAFPDYLHIESIRARSIHHDWKFRPHQHHNLHQFFYIIKGEGTVVIDKVEYKLTDNQFISMPALTVHGFNFSPDTEGWVLTLPQIYLLDIISNIAFLAKPIAQPLIQNCTNSQLQPELGYIFKSINSVHQDNHKLRDFQLRTYANLLIGKIADLYPQQDDILPNIPQQKLQIIQDFQNAVNERFKQRLSVTQYAALLNITATHLNRICKSVLNMSPLQLINERCLLEAKRLLSYTSMSVSEISFELGFCDAAHFSKYFLNKTSKTPSGFRKKLGH